MLSGSRLDELFSAIDGKDTERFMSFLSYEPTFRFGSMEPVTGRAAVAAAVDGFFASIQGLSHRILETWQGTGSQACQGEVTYIRHDARTVTLPFAIVFRFVDGLIDDYLIHIDPAPLFSQNGGG